MTILNKIFINNIISFIRLFNIVTNYFLNKIKIFYFNLKSYLYGGLRLIFIIHIF